MRDWGIVAAVLVPLILFAISGWVQSDRLITEVLIRQQGMMDRLERVEETLDKAAR
jgi:hypothetical protein